MGQFGSKKSPKELLRENKRLIQRAIRELDRERATLERQEKQLVNDIKQLAKKNQMVCARWDGFWARSWVEPDDTPSIFPHSRREGVGEYHGEGFGAHATIRLQVLPDALPAAGGGAQTTGGPAQ